jgi:hypothetical protein
MNFWNKKELKKIKSEIKNVENQEALDHVH